MFAPDSAVRRMHSEGVLLLGGGRALLMQVAHPLVARGVAEHSTYRRDRMGRLLRTLRPMFAIAYGTREEAVRAASAVRARHERVTGDGYRADDEELLLWVLATLIDTALLMRRRFAAPLPAGDDERYYAEMLVVGEALGMPRSCAPPDLAAFERYMGEMVATLDVTDEARAIAGDLFAPAPEAPWLAPALPLVRELTAGLLPPRLREQYGLPWGPAREAALEAAARLSRAALPRAPHALRAPPLLLMPTSWRERARR